MNLSFTFWKEFWPSLPNLIPIRLIYFFHPPPQPFKMQEVSELSYLEQTGFSIIWTWKPQKGMVFISAWFVKSGSR